MTVPRYEKCTVWSPGERDPETNLITAGEARVYQCEARKGGKIKYANSTGVEFMPRSTFWFRSDDILEGVHAEPEENWLVARGEHIGVDPNSVGAEIIKAVIVHSNAKFNQPDSYEIGTQ